MLIIIKFLKTNIKKCDLGLKEIPHSKNIQLGKINSFLFKISNSNLKASLYKINDLFYNAFTCV